MSGARVQVIAARPSLIGLDVEKNLTKIVEYLKANNYSMDDIVKYISTTL